MSATDKFFEEMLRSAESKAKRNVRAEVAALRKENTRLKKLESTYTTTKEKIESQYNTQKKELDTQAKKDKIHLNAERKALEVREKNILRVEQELAFKLKEINKVYSMPLSKFVQTYSRGYYGGKSEKAKVADNLIKESAGDKKRLRKNRKSNQLDSE